MDKFHDDFVYHLLLNGLAKKGDDLESIKMTKSPKVSKKYCEKIVGGLTHIEPSLIVKLVEDGSTKLECIFTHINDKKMINDVCMIQNVVGWPQQDRYSCQVWYLGKNNIDQIKEFWDEDL